MTLPARRASEQAVELRIDLIGNRGEILWTILEIKTIGIYGQDLAGIFGNPLLVTGIETLKILYFNAFLVLAATLLNLGHKMRNRTAEIDEKVWSLDKRHHQLEKLHVGIIITISQIAHRLVVGDKDIDALENSPVLNDNIFRMSDFQDILETLVRK